MKKSLKIIGYILLITITIFIFIFQNLFDEYILNLILKYTDEGTF